MRTEWNMTKGEEEGDEKNGRLIVQFNILKIRHILKTKVRFLVRYVSFDTRVI